jgi:hypothetical protein
LSRARLGYRWVAELSTAEEMHVARGRVTVAGITVPAFPHHALRLGELPPRQSCTCQFEAAVTT